MSSRIVRSRWSADAAASVMVASLAASLAACGGDSQPAIPIDAATAGAPLPDQVPGALPIVSIAPEALDDGWATSTPAAEAIDTPALEGILRSIRDGSYRRVDSMIVARHGSEPGTSCQP